MELLFKLSAATLLSLVLLMILERQEKHIAILLCVAVCCMIAAASTEIFQHVIRLLRQLQKTAKLDSDMVSSLLKAATCAILCEITSTVCAEAGYGSIGKMLQLAGVGMILYFSIPFISALLELVTQMLGGL